MERETPHQCFLDLSLSSNLLSAKIADIPHKLKYETIIAPIFEYCFQTSDQDKVWDSLTSKELEIYSESNHEEILETKTDNTNLSFIMITLKIDWIRDETFLYNNIFHLTEAKINVLGIKLGLWKKREFLMKAAKYGLKLFGYYSIPQSCYNDRELVLACTRERFFELNEFKFDTEITKAQLETMGKHLLYVPEEFKQNREIVKVAVRNDGSVLEYAAEEFRDDKELVLIALESVPIIYNNISDRLKEDRDIVLKAISVFTSFRHRFFINEIPDKFKNDREVLNEISKIDGYKAILFASDELVNDKDFVRMAVQQNFAAFELASSELKIDREFVEEMVKNHGECLIFSAEEYHDDEEIVELALKSSPDAIHFISDRLRQDIEFTSKLIGKRGFKQLASEFSNDREIVLASSVKIASTNLKWASFELQNDREFILQAVETNGMALKCIKERFKSDREIVLRAVSQNGNSLQFAPIQFFDDKQIIIKASESKIENSLFLEFKIAHSLRNDIEYITKCGTFITTFPRKFRIDREVLMKVLKANPYQAFENTSPAIRTTDRVFIIRVLKSDGLVLRVVGYQYRNDREIVSLAMKQNKLAFLYASEELKNDPEMLKLFHSL